MVIVIVTRWLPHLQVIEDSFWGTVVGLPENIWRFP